jgi:hypothetical protein
LSGTLTTSFSQMNSGMFLMLRQHGAGLEETARLLLPYPGRLPNGRNPVINNADASEGLLHSADRLSCLHP